VLHDYITRVVGRYAGRVAQWDVVNEALYSTSGTPQGPYNVTGDPRNLWGEVIGPEYIADAFLWAHEADPSAQLFYNDYGAESPSPKFDAELRLVKALKAHGVPITGVGLQTHRPVPRNPPYYPTEPQVTKVLKSLAAIGLHSEITELDQQLPLPARPAMLQLQGTLYQQMVTACLSVALCTGVTVWGLDDSDRYQQLKANNTGAATLFGTNGQVKPSFRGVVRALLNAPGPAKADRASPGPAP
jgi:endo-1,4-beta-xylanase